MKPTILCSLAAFTLAACGTTTSPGEGGSCSSCGGASSTGGSSSSATTAGGSSSSSSSGSKGGSSSSGGASGCAGDTNGGITVTLTSVGVHPAALAALQALSLTPPVLAGNYSIELQGVALVGGAASITTIDTQALTSANVNGPITFCNEQIPAAEASLGLIAAIVAPSGTAPATLPTCAQVTAGTSGGFTDGYVGAASQLIFGKVTGDINNAAAFALPASYVSILDCAAGFTPGSTSAPDLLSQGFALLYASNDGAGGGGPLSGVSFNYTQSGLIYYPAGYAAGSASASGPTSGNGVATITDITGVATVAATGPGTFSARHIGTSANGAYQVFYAPGT